MSCSYIKCIYRRFNALTHKEIILSCINNYWENFKCIICKIPFCNRYSILRIAFSGFLLLCVLIFIIYFSLRRFLTQVYALLHYCNTKIIIRMGILFEFVIPKLYLLTFCICCLRILQNILLNFKSHSLKFFCLFAK